MGDAGSGGVSEQEPAPSAPPPVGTTESKLRAALELGALWLGTLLLIRAAKMIYEVLPGLGADSAVGRLEPRQIVLAAVPVLFMYAPVLVCRLRGVDPDRYLLALPAFGDWRLWRSALALSGLVIGIILVPWVLGYHAFHTQIAGWLGDRFHLAGLDWRQFEGTLPGYLENADTPALAWSIFISMLTLVGYHVFFVGIPEEMFYRGYVQTRLDELFGTPASVLGAKVGYGLLLTSVIFAAGHSIVEFQWWHFAIFFPSLLFGWMRARSGDIVAGALFHAFCNISATTLDTLYGVIPPGGPPH